MLKREMHPKEENHKVIWLLTPWYIDKTIHFFYTGGYTHLFFSHNIVCPSCLLPISMDSLFYSCFLVVLHTAEIRGEKPWNIPIQFVQVVTNCISVFGRKLFSWLLNRCLVNRTPASRTVFLTSAFISTFFFCPLWGKSIFLIKYKLLYSFYYILLWVESVFQKNFWLILIGWSYKFSYYYCRAFNP